MTDAPGTIRRTRSRTAATIGVLIMAVVAAGCGGRLDGRTYRSVKVEGRDLVPDTTITLSFDDGHLSFEAGCNINTTPYQLSGDRLTIGGDGSSTLMGCEPGLSEQDLWLGRWFRKGLRIDEKDDSLVLDGGGVSIEFRRI